MPKNQPTAAKKARQAARAGAKYTAALREAGGPHLPPHLELVDEGALSAGDRLIVEGLRALAAAGEPLPLRMADPDPEVVQALSRVQEKGTEAQWQRWASVEAAVDGYVLRETRYGPDRSGYSPTSRGPRVPVPVRAADGTVTVVAMPEWARLTESGWIWAHTGWPLDDPGQIVHPPQTFSPAPGLRWQVAVWHVHGNGEKVLGEDYAGSAPAWQTVGWCTSRDDARQIARAYTAHRGDYARADVIEHGTDNGTVSATADTYLQAPDAPERPRPATAPGPRPISPARTEIAEPAWYGRAATGATRPDSSLIVWTGTGWKTLVWTNRQTAMIAQNLAIGAGGPYEWAEDWGPRHPDRDLHDWTREGRDLHGRYPDPGFAERARLVDAARRAHQDALIGALADRGGLTRQQAADRLAQGGQRYRQFLDVGQATIARALHTARRALPEGPERTAIRHALDDLTERCLPPADAERIAAAQLDRESEANPSSKVTAWCRRAVAEYLAPAPDPHAADIDGFEGFEGFEGAAPQSA